MNGTGWLGRPRGGRGRKEVKATGVITHGAVQKARQGRNLLLPMAQPQAESVPTCKQLRQKIIQKKNVNDTRGLEKSLFKAKIMNRDF